MKDKNNKCHLNTTKNRLKFNGNFLNEKYICLDSCYFFDTVINI